MKVLMKKFFITTFVLTFCLFLYSESASATENPEIKSLPNQDQLGVISEKYDIELITNPSEDIINPNLKFDNIEEFEEYLKENKTQLDLPQEQDKQQTHLIDIKITEDNTILPMATTYSKYHNESWWSPMNGPVMGVLSTKNIDFNYHYTKNSYGTATVTKLTNINSRLTGYHDVKWTPRNNASTYSIRGTKGVNVIAKGTYTLGVVIGAQPIGYSWDAEWERHIDLTKF